MDHLTRTRLYAHVHVLFWPWLWWQLLRLEAWIETTERPILISVDRWGNVYCNLVGDDPLRPIAWSPMPARKTPWSPYTGGCPVLARLGAGLSIDPTRTGDQTRLATLLLSYNGRSRATSTHRAAIGLAVRLDLGPDTVKVPP